MFHTLRPSFIVCPCDIRFRSKRREFQQLLIRFYVNRCDKQQSVLTENYKSVFCLFMSIDQLAETWSLYIPGTSNALSNQNDRL